MAKSKDAETGGGDAAAAQVRHAAEAHMGKTNREKRAENSGKAEAQSVDAHFELSHPKHSKGQPLPGNQDR